jgi:hypothetical protein
MSATSARLLRRLHPSSSSSTPVATSTATSVHAMKEAAEEVVVVVAAAAAAAAVEEASSSVTAVAEADTAVGAKHCFLRSSTASRIKLFLFLSTPFHHYCARGACVVQLLAC